MPLLLLCACASTRLARAPVASSAPADSLYYSVVLIGNTGEATADTPAMQLLASHLSEMGEQSAVVFLGDNAYPHGLPEPGHPSRPGAEAHLSVQLDAVTDFKGQVVFIPGNRDWGATGNAREALARQEAFIEDSLDRGNTFLPDEGDPGPAILKLADGVRLVVLDTQWWLADPAPARGEARSVGPSVVLSALSDALYKHRNDNVIVVGHHPMASNGEYGGHFSWRRYLSPIPIIGAITPLYRRFFGHPQDLAARRYRLLRRELRQAFKQADYLVYAAAHDHSLQHFAETSPGRGYHYLVSGAGSKATYVEQGHGAEFIAGRQGFAKLLYYRDGSAWLEMWGAGTRPEGELMYRTRLRERVPAAPETVPVTLPDVVAALPDSVELPVAPRYDRAGSVQRFLQGEGYRELWGMPVKAPVLDIGTEYGGLVPYRRGGNSQSTTIWMRAASGRTYMLRSIDKATGRSWSPELQQTIAQDVVQDRIAMQHPFGALMVPPLASAAGVYHTNPRLVYVPDDPRMGEFQDALAGQLVLIEERPDEDMSDVASMGGATNVIGSAKLFREIDNDNDHRVDGEAWARSRLIDMLISDHDRTPDNVRWAAFEPYERDSSLTGEARKQGKIYVPVPRDRDMAFLQVDGLAPRLYRYLAEPTWQDFDAEYGRISGLNAKPILLDRRFAGELTRQDWLRLAETVATALTDSVLHEAVRRLPAPAQAAWGRQAFETLLARRDGLVAATARYYNGLARTADVVGSHKHERFEAVHHPDGSLAVSMYKTSKEGEIRKLLFRRVYVPSETREVRLYGQDGRDQFVVQGEGRAQIRLRAIGGPGEDQFTETAARDGRLLHVYDTPPDTAINVGGKARVELSDDPAPNRYDRNDFALNDDLVVPIVGYDPDQGVLVGASARVTRHGFRKRPFARQHNISAQFSAANVALAVRYQGRYTELFGAWDLAAEASLESPGTIYNFYGLGNETEEERSRAFYQTEFARAHVRPQALRELARGVSLRVGPALSFTDVREDQDRFVGTAQAGVSAGTFGRLLYAGLIAGLDVEAVDQEANPRQGFRWYTNMAMRTGLSKSADPYARATSTLAIYASLIAPRQVTAAARIGATHLVGSFPFFDAATLGGVSGLRGYRSTRFAGRSAAFQNLELRAEIVQLAGALGYGEIGVFAFFDNGRVWTDGEDSRRWHQGYGGGLWAFLFDATTLTVSYGHSVEGAVVTAGVGWAY
ncbi:MAG: BamA/TamA family outer membrane protein [Bacteroidota bacterium]